MHFFICGPLKILFLCSGPPKEKFLGPPLVRRSIKELEWNVRSRIHGNLNSKNLDFEENGVWKKGIRKGRVLNFKVGERIFGQKPSI